MGNQLDRITHLSYSELPTGDPSGIEKDELRVGVAYFFSDEEEDLDERGGGGGGGQQQAQVEPGHYRARGSHSSSSSSSSSSNPAQETTPKHHHHYHPHYYYHHQLVLSEPQFSAFRGQECIFSKVSSNGNGSNGNGSSDPLSLYPSSALPSLCQPGDLVELLSLGSPPDPPPPPPPHWAVYVGAGQAVHLHQGQIREDGVVQLGQVGRVVSDWYRYRPLVAELVVQNARGHLGLASPELCWANSESFAAWCRFGKREFKAGGELTPPATGSAPQQQQQQYYYLKVHLAGDKVHTGRFRSLEELIREKRRIEATGRLRVLQEMAAIRDQEEGKE